MIQQLKITIATARRILLQLMHDPRTIVLMIGAPVLLMWLLSWVFSDTKQVFDHIAPALLGVFPFVIMFLVTSITTLRERTSGTMERLMAMPVNKFSIIAGYALAFGIIGAAQSVIVSTFAVYVLAMDTAGPQWFMILVAIADTLMGVALGLLVSAFARTEFQAVQFMPALIFPQFLVCGLLVPLDKLPDLLEKIAYCLPLTYAVDALNGVVNNTTITAEMWRDVEAIIGFSIVALLLASMTLRRRSA
jgi:ABC-2 type transport system permease protein